MKGKQNIEPMIIFIIFLLFLVLFFLWKLKMQTILKDKLNHLLDNITEEKEYFFITIFKIGKADAILLETKYYTILIDAGEQQHAKEILNYLSKKKISKLNAFIITHFDKDHVGGANKIIKNIKIDKIYQPAYETNRKQYKDYRKTAQAAKLEIIHLTKDFSFKWNDVVFTIFPPKNDYYEKENDYSLIVKAVHKKNSFLFTGDAQEERLNELLENTIFESTVLKVPHHGKAEINSKEFLKMVHPSYAVITCSKKNPPDKEIISVLKHLGTETLLTKNGTVIITSDGEKIFTAFQ